MASAAMTLEVEEKILEDAISSPAVAMMRLSLEIDRQLRLFLATLGRLKDYTGQSPSEALGLVEKSMIGHIPAELRDTVKSFWDLRNRVVHGSGSQQGYAMRAVDYGLRILRMLRAIPRPSRIVRVSSVPLCSDSACDRLRTDVRGVILEDFGYKGESQGLHIYPSKNSYVSGQSLTWEWDLTGPGWDATWYRDPFSNEIKLAWSDSLEYVGRPLELV
jgi:hypothetical protein